MNSLGYAAQLFSHHQPSFIRALGWCSSYLLLVLRGGKSGWPWSSVHCVQSLVSTCCSSAAVNFCDQHLILACVFLPVVNCVIMTSEYLVHKADRRWVLNLILLNYDSSTSYFQELVQSHRASHQLTVRRSRQYFASLPQMQQNAFRA